MAGMTRGTYFLGWLCLIGAMVLRFASLSRDMGAMMREVNILPRNFLELSLVLFVMCLASDAYHRSQQK